MTSMPCRRSEAAASRGCANASHPLAESCARATTAAKENHYVGRHPLGYRWATQKLRARAGAVDFSTTERHSVCVTWPRFMTTATASVRLLRLAALSVVFCGCIAVKSSGQTPQLVFTAPAPEQDPPPGPQISAVVRERGLALWAGTTSDFGVGVTLSGSRSAVQSITSMTTLTVDGRDRPTFQQIDIVRSVVSRGSLLIAGGGGIREQWDGTRVLIGRALAGSALGGGRLQGSVVVERTLSSSFKHDAADIVTSLGWSRRIKPGFTAGVEAIAQDLEGLWNPTESDGGAKLVAGPSLHVQSQSGNWSANLTACPVVQTIARASSSEASTSNFSSGSHHFAVFASATWVPAVHR